MIPWDIDNPRVPGAYVVTGFVSGQSDNDHWAGSWLVACFTGSPDDGGGLYWALLPDDYHGDLPVTLLMLPQGAAVFGTMAQACHCIGWGGFEYPCFWGDVASIRVQPVIVPAGVDPYR